MFHCNGWCTPWAVTAIGGTHVCLRGVNAAEIWRLLDNEGITHFDAAATVLVAVANAQQAHRLRPASHRNDWGCATQPHDYRANVGVRCQNRALLWPYRDLWSIHGL